MSAFTLDTLRILKRVVELVYRSRRQPTISAKEKIKCALQGGEMVEIPFINQRYLDKLMDSDSCQRGAVGFAL